jgi:hypothetical protein
MYPGKEKFVSFRADFSSSDINAIDSHIANMCSTSREPIGA